MTTFRWWAAGVAAVTLTVLLIDATVPGSLIDLDVYRAGGAAWLHGVPLYTDAFPSWLPFTYPPVAAVLFSVPAMLPLPVAAAVLTVAGLAALTVTVLLAAPLRIRGPLAAMAVVGVCVFEPVRTTLLFGQVNLVLMGLVAVDCLMPRTRHPRGLLVGVAAAVKLTPAIFVLFFLARRQYAAAVTTVVTFAAVTGAGMLLAPADSVTYWHTTIFDPDRIGGAMFVTNQSLRGALSRLGLPDGLWFALVAAVLAAAWRGARRATEPVVALLLVAAAGLLASPVSWSHHWVWVVPALAVLAGRAAVPTAAVFTVGHRFLPHARGREAEWTWWQHVVGNTYLLAAVAFLACCLHSDLRLRRVRTGGSAEKVHHRSSMTRLKV
ncbi:glycosyltransferase 87 family protein [Actinophytocola sp. KF-1]